MPDAAMDQIVVVEKMSAGGDGLAHLGDGRVVFVHGAWPDEHVLIRLTTNKRDFAKAEVVTVMQPSEQRVAAPCPARLAGCGGCAWQHGQSAAQLHWKADIVVDALRRTARLIDPPVVVGAAVSPWDYRTSARCSAGADGRLGFRAESSHRTVVADRCLVAHPRLASLIAGTSVSGADEVSLRVSLASDEMTVWAGRGSVTTLSGVGIGPDATVTELAGGCQLRVSAASFFQSGPQAVELLVDAVRRAAGDSIDDVGVVDAYAGVGVFSAALGLRRPVLIESSASSIADARLNVAHLDPEIVAGKVEVWDPLPSPLVIADPARAGLDRVAVSRLAATGAAVLVLVSCDPVALARDTTLLAAEGFELATAEVIDLFPQTHHVEVVSRFQRHKKL